MNATVRTADLLTTRTETIRDRSDLQARGIVADVIASIDAGVLKPGDRLPDERSLCARYAVGRHTLRKAMETLEGQGLVGRFVGRGSFVLERAARRKAAQPAATPRSWSLFELTEARLLVEPGLAALVVERATPADFARLEQCLDAIGLAASWRQFKEAKYAFHRTLAQIARNDFIGHIFDQIVASRRLAWDGYSPRSQDLAAVRATCLDESRAVYDALARGDADGAADALRRSITRLLVSIGAS
jgi:DNA-binding FadR family transcriptional regulator